MQEIERFTKQQHPGEGHRGLRPRGQASAPSPSPWAARPSGAAPARPPSRDVMHGRGQGRAPRDDAAHPRKQGRPGRAQWRRWPATAAASVAAAATAGPGCTGGPQRQWWRSGRRVARARAARARPRTEGPARTPAPRARTMRHAPQSHLPHEERQPRHHGNSHSPTQADAVAHLRAEAVAGAAGQPDPLRTSVDSLARPRPSRRRRWRLRRQSFRAAVAVRAAAAVVVARAAATAVVAATAAAAVAAPSAAESQRPHSSVKGRAAPFFGPGMRELSPAAGPLWRSNRCTLSLPITSPTIWSGWASTRAVHREGISCAPPTSTSSSVSAPVGSTTMTFAGTPFEAVGPACVAGPHAIVHGLARRPPPWPAGAGHKAPCASTLHWAVGAPHRALQHVHRRRADELGDEQVVGAVIEFERRADLLDRAVVHPMARPNPAIAQRKSDPNSTQIMALGRVIACRASLVVISTFFGIVNSPRP